MVLAAVGQFCATSNLAHNAQIIKTLIHKASAAGAAVLFLPEAADYIAGSPAESVALAAPIETAQVYVQGVLAGLNELPEGAVRPYVSVGVHEPAEGGTRVKNTLLWVEPDGTIRHRYQKVHLFDVDIR